MRRSMNVYINNWKDEKDTDSVFEGKSTKPMTLEEWACAVTEGRQHTFNAQNVQTIKTILAKINGIGEASKKTFSKMIIGGTQSDRLLYANMTNSINQIMDEVVQETLRMVTSTKLGILLQGIEYALMINDPITAGVDWTVNWSADLAARAMASQGKEMKNAGAVKDATKTILSTILVHMASKNAVGAIIMMVDLAWDVGKVPLIKLIMNELGWDAKFIRDGAWNFGNQPDLAVYNSKAKSHCYSPFFYYAGKSGHGAFSRSPQSIPGLFHYDDLRFMAYGAGGNTFFGKTYLATEKQFLIDYGQVMIPHKTEEQVVEELVGNNTDPLKFFMETYNMRKSKTPMGNVKDFIFGKVKETALTIVAASQDHHAAIKYGFDAWKPPEGR